MMYLQGAGMGDAITDLFTGAGQYVTNAAETGAQAAIPQIQQQVQQTVEPYVLASLALGLIGVAFGMAGFLKAKKLEGRRGLTGRRR